MKVFSERLKKLIKEEGITAYRVAKIVGVSNQCVLNWLDERNEPKISYLVKLADYFNVSCDYLLGRADYTQ